MPKKEHIPAGYQQMLKRTQQIENESLESRAANNPIWQMLSKDADGRVLLLQMPFEDQDNQETTTDLQSRIKQIQDRSNP